MNGFGLRNHPRLKRAAKAVPLCLSGALLLGDGLRTVPAQEVPPGFAVEILAMNLNAATAIVPLPDGRILIAEQTGRILVWKNGSVLPEPALALHVTDYWERGLIGLTVSPSFPARPHVFACYVTDRPFVHHVVSRFAMEDDVIDPATEHVLLEGDDQEAFGGFKKAGHQGGAMRFGHDGKLYISIGEQTAKTPSQDLGALQGSILRLNEDGTIPEDNPFWDRTQGKYRSIYAWGVRNCFGIAAQPVADGGRLFFTDVGETRFEEVNELRAGGNYGWPHAEGPSDDPRFIAPLHAYDQTVGKSVCGGLFYPAFPNFGEGNLPEKWRGRFFFVDWANHWIKALSPRAPDSVLTFGGGFDAPVAIELGPDGSLLVLNRGTIWRDGNKFEKNSGSLVRIRYAARTDPAWAADAAPPPPAALGLPGRYWDLPRDLSELPLFPWLQSQAQGRGRPARGLPGRVRSYVLNSPPWLPGVRVKRWWALPESREAQFQFTETGPWEMPPGAVLIHHYQTADLERKPLETRFIVAGRRAFYGASYRWAEDAEAATLVEDPDAASLGEGLHWPLAAPEPFLSWPGGSLSYVPDLSTKQLNRPGPDNPVRRWAEAGFVAGVPGNAALARLPALVAHDETGVSVERRIRSFLDVNCAACHRPGGNSRGQFDARLETSLAETGMIGGLPEAGDLGVPGARIVAPGRPEQSVLWRRLAGEDLYRMPPVRYHAETPPIVADVEAWIRSLR